MSYFLKQSTQAFVKFGPFLDEDDGKTVEPSLTIAQADIRLSKNGGNIGQTSTAGSASYDETGFYNITLSVADTGVLGSLLVAVHVSGALPVFQYFAVISENVWDSLFSSDKLQVHAAEISNDLITAASIAANAIGASELATDAIGSDQLADSAVTKIFAYVAEGTLTFVKMFRVLYAVLAGKSAGGGTTTITFRDVADGKDRVSATVDSSGNRTGMTNDGA